MAEKLHLDPVRIAMVGGGPGAFIGPVHRMAAELDGVARIVAGAFSSDPQRARDGARLCGLPEDRGYADWRALIAAEAARPDGAEAVAIVTPNHLHLPVALAALEAGLHVISDKPATATLDEALALRDAVSRSGKVYALTYTYTGYAMIRHARALVAAGAIGAVRKVTARYAQGWLAERVEAEGNRQAQWRVDPARAGLGGCIGDIGVHAFNLIEYVSGLTVERFVADLSALVSGRDLDDDCNVLLRFAGGAPGVLTASQVATGERNDLRLHVHGTKATLAWSHEDPGSLTILWPGGRSETLRAGSPGITGPARLPTGHPEGFIEAFATLYSDFAAAVRGQTGLVDAQLPGIRAGMRSMRFVERAVSASAVAAGWTQFDDDNATIPAGESA